MKTRFGLTAAVALAALAAGGCSIERFAIRKAAGMLTGPSGTDVFSSDNDPELVGDALPFALKFYESLLAAVPDHEGLRLRTGSLYIMYAGAFLQTRADLLPRDRIEEKETLRARAKNLYLRGRDMIIVSLERKNPVLQRQWRERLYAEAVAPFAPKDVPLLYWAAAGWVAAYAIDPMDMELAVSLPRAEALMNRVLELDPGYSGGAVHTFFILYYGSLPDYMGGDTEKAREHFRLAEAASGGRDVSAFLALASTVSVKEQNVGEFRSLLEKVLSVDPDADPGSRLSTVLSQRKARRLLEHIDDYFLTDDHAPGHYFEAPPGRPGGTS
jgi:predicted anti-sigma-YlaC factor YlaD